jgi:hypothetical protein
MQRTLILLLLIIPALADGCASLEARRHASELQIMRQDDEYCVSRGLHYPDTAYVSCRYTVQNSRARQQWKCLQLANAAASPKSLVTPPVNNAPENFRPLDRDHFECWPEPQLGGTYIFCGERAKPKP